MEHYRTSLIIFGTLIRNFEDELNGAEPVSDVFPELFVYSLTKYTWTRVMVDPDAIFIAFPSVARTSESEQFLYGGVYIKAL